MSRIWTTSQDAGGDLEAARQDGADARVPEHSARLRDGRNRGRMPAGLRAQNRLSHRRELHPQGKCSAGQRQQQPAGHQGGGRAGSGSGGEPAQVGAEVDAYRANLVQYSGN